VTGTSSRTINFARALTGKGHRTFILTFKENPEAEPLEDYNGIVIIRLDTYMPVKFYEERMKTELRFLLRGGFMKLLSKIRHVVSRWNIDILHYASYFPSLIGILVKKLTAWPFIADLHASASMEALSRGKYTYFVECLMLEKIICRTADAVVVTTPELGEYLSSRYGGNIHVVPDCINTDWLVPKPEIGHEIKRRHGIDEGEYVLFFHGSPYPENIRALGEISKILNSLNNIGFKTKAIIAGKFCNKPVKNPNMVYAGYVDDLPGYISSADLAILPVRMKSAGLRTRLMEYLACGLPVVTTEEGVTGFRFTVESGCVVVAGDTKDMIVKVASLLEDEDLRRRMSLIARRVAEDNFSPKVAAERLEKVFMEVLEK